MQYRKLGKSELEISQIAFGCRAIGGWIYGNADDKDSIYGIQGALDAGINFFDTADIYGQGHSETILARALGKKRKGVIISTKGGVRFENKKFNTDLSSEYIKKAIDASLKRLRTDYIDLYQPQWSDPKTPLEETFKALNECVKKGKIRYIGISNFDSNQILDSIKLSKIVAHQTPLNLFKRESEVVVIPQLFKHNISVLAYAPLAKGLLTGKYTLNSELFDMDRSSDPLFRGETFKRNIRIVKRLKKFAAERHRSITELAIAWVLAHPGVTSALCGARCHSQITESARAVDWQLQQSELSEIDTIIATSV